MTKTKRAALELYVQLRELEDAYERACKKAFPSMSLVEYEHGDRIRKVRVISHGKGSMRVIGNSGSQYDLAYYFPMMLLEKRRQMAGNSA